MAEKKRILIVCGEASGDLNAGHLARALFSLDPRLEISGIGGTHLRASGARIVRDIKDLTCFGLFDVLKKLPLFFKLRDELLRNIRLEKPDAVILIDFSGFNLRLAQAIDTTVPVIYYISPQVWASRQGRIETIRRYVHRMIVLFPFEKEFYLRHGINADLVGHPLLDIVKPQMHKDEFLKSLGLNEAAATIALLPGSRRSEIRLILPVMLAACARIRRTLGNAQFIVAKSPHVDAQIYHEIIRRSGLTVSLPEGKTHDCLNAADFCLVASGTATLEAAIMQKPFLIVYRMGMLNYLLYRPQVKIPCIGMVNIVAGKKIIPEFIQTRATAAHIAAETIAVLTDAPRMEQMKAELAAVKASLGEPGAALRAAHIVYDIIKT